MNTTQATQREPSVNADTEQLATHVPEALRVFCYAMLASSAPVTRAQILIGLTHIVLRKHARVATFSADSKRAKQLGDLETILAYSREHAELSLRDHEQRMQLTEPKPLRALTQPKALRALDRAEAMTLAAVASAYCLPGPNGEYLDGAEPYEVARIMVDIATALAELQRITTEHPDPEWRDCDETVAVFLLVAELVRGWIAHDKKLQRQLQRH